ncbi:MAG: 7-carboxy-7-deazaguanine synthase QueE [Thermoplasmata archaeon]
MSTTTQLARMEAAADRLAVSEIFHSIQGEGPMAGFPATFLRLGFCNLRCVWCDTKYTWDWDQYDPKREVHSLPLAEVQRRLKAFPCEHLVITGGEPLLQQRALESMLGQLAEDGCFIEVETAGTIVPSPALQRIVLQWNVSPKLENSGNPREKRENGDAMRTLVASDRAFFKFVLCEPTDVEEVNALVARYAIDQNRVILMPEAVEPDSLARRGPWVADLCEEYGYRFSSRLQIDWWGGARGF